MTIDQLPRWVQLTYTALDNLPTTQLRLLAGVVLAESLVVFLMVAMWTNHKLDAGVLEYTLVFVATMNGLAITQFTAKKVIDKPPVDKP